MSKYIKPSFNDIEILKEVQSYGGRWKVDPKTQVYYDEIDRRIYTLYKNKLKNTIQWIIKFMLGDIIDQIQKDHGDDAVMGTYLWIILLL